MLAPAPANAATVQVVVANPVIVAMWAENAYTVTEGEVVNATVTLRTAAGVPKPRKAFSFSVLSVRDTAQAGDDYTDASLTLAVQPGDWTADGAGFAASVPVSAATVNDSVVEADERFYLAVGTAPCSPRSASIAPSGSGTWEGRRAALPRSPSRTTNSG